MIDGATMWLYCGLIVFGAALLQPPGVETAAIVKRQAAWWQGLYNLRSSPPRAPSSNSAGIEDTDGDGNDTFNGDSISGISNNGDNHSTDVGDVNNRNETDVGDVNNRNDSDVDSVNGVHNTNSIKTGKGNIRVSSGGRRGGSSQGTRTIKMTRVLRTNNTTQRSPGDRKGPTAGPVSRTTPRTGRRKG